MATRYTMPISPLAVDKLGVKLYDKVSAVLAELIANAYDADAAKVTVSAPMGQYLATRRNSTVHDKGLSIVVEDDGIGMTPSEMQGHFLPVGGERREDPERGSQSRLKKRKVMGRKGIGKLAPFGICKRIEVISSGGPATDSADNPGYRTSHVVLTYQGILDAAKSGIEYMPHAGECDDTVGPRRGTRVILTDFDYRAVPNLTVLSRQIARRFGISSSDWQITVADNSGSGETTIVDAFDVPTMPNTRLSFEEDGSVVDPEGSRYTDLEAGFYLEGQFYPVNGWMAYATRPYKDELMAGVRIYCRGKIAAQTSVFNRPAGFTGENIIRSYLVGELSADWLDNEDDLIQTDRRDILWSDRRGVEFEKWGQRVVTKIGRISRNPVQRKVLDVFWTTGDVDQRIREAYPDPQQDAIRQDATELAKTLGRRVAPEEARDHTVVSDLVNLVILFAPHVTLSDMLRKASVSPATPLVTLADCLRTARIAELSSFGQVAQERVRIIRQLESKLETPDTPEKDLQEIVAMAPWLLNPEWSIVTANQQLKTLQKEFEKFYKKETGMAISLDAFAEPTRRPDFVLTSQDGRLQLVEIKSPGHSLTNAEMDRIVSYRNCMAKFLEDEGNKHFRRLFPWFHITLVCDHHSLTGSPGAAFDGYLATQELTCVNWSSFLAKTKTVHHAFLEEAARLRVVSGPRSRG